MSDRIVVMPGPGRVDLPVLHTVACEFGWVVELAQHGLCEVTAAQAYGRRTSAVLFHRNTFGAGYSWPETIQRLKLALPEVRLVACRGFAESIDWPVLSEAEQSTPYRGHERLQVKDAVPLQRAHAAPELFLLIDDASSSSLGSSSISCYLPRAAGRQGGFSGHQIHDGSSQCGTDCSSQGLGSSQLMVHRSQACSAGAL